jgi:hypothetical protein
MTPLFLTSALDGGEWSASSTCRFTPGDRQPGTYCIGGWVGSGVEKYLLARLGIDLPPSSPWSATAIPAPTCTCVCDMNVL